MRGFVGGKNEGVTMSNKTNIKFLETLSKSDAEKAKAFLSSRTDKFRPPYGKEVKKAC